MRVVNTLEMQKIFEVCQGKYHLSESLMIENIGFLGARWVAKKLFEKSGKDFTEIIGIVGTGQNGAFGMAIMRQLHQLSYKTRAFIISPESIKSLALKEQIIMAEDFGVKINSMTKAEQLSSYFNETQGEFLVIDAIFGIGERDSLSEFLFDTFNLINHKASTVVSIDMPSGICSDRGKKEEAAISANYTLAVGPPKIGHYIAEGPLYVGELETLQEAFPKELLVDGQTATLTRKACREALFPRSKYAHKNSFGHTLVVGGSFGLTGAICLACEAALKVGTGLVTGATWRENYGEFQSKVLSEVMTGIIPTTEKDKSAEISHFDRYDCIVVGPGLGQGPYARNIVLDILNTFSGPVVIDADALNCLSLKEDEESLRERQAPTILTPHIGELARFANVEKKNLLENPLGFLKELVESLNSTIIIKGPCTYLGTPDGQRWIHSCPNDGMATGGSGDVLAGILGGLLAQVNPAANEEGIFRENSSFYAATCLGVLCHSLAGQYALKKYGARGMLAHSIIEGLPQSF